MYQTLDELGKRILLSGIDIPDGQSAIIVEKKENPHALFNLQPHLNFNLIHYSLLQRIAYLHKQHIKTTVIFYDTTIRSGSFSKEIKTEAEATVAMDWIYSMFIKFPNIEQELLEFIPESCIWKIDEFRGSFHERFLALVKIASDFIKIDNKADQYIDSMIDVLIGITYEGMIKPDFVLFAGEESTIWNNVRNRQKLSTIFSKDFKPPIIFRVKNIYKYDGSKLLTTWDKDDPISNHLKSNQAQDLSKYPPAKPGALEYVSRSKRLNRDANAALNLG